MTPGKSHSFSDLNRLPNGEIGIAWLDDKMPGKDSRSVKFVQTLPGGGFSEEIIVDDNACQCCRTNVFVDSKTKFTSPGAICYPLHSPVILVPVTLAPLFLPMAGKHFRPRSQ